MQIENGSNLKINERGFSRNEGWGQPQQPFVAVVGGCELSPRASTESQDVTVFRSYML